MNRVLTSVGGGSRRRPRLKVGLSTYNRLREARLPFQSETGFHTATSGGLALTFQPAYCSSAAVPLSRPS